MPIGYIQISIIFKIKHYKSKIEYLHETRKINHLQVLEKTQQGTVK